MLLSLRLESLKKFGGHFVKTMLHYYLEQRQGAQYFAALYKNR